MSRCDANQILSGAGCLACADRGALAVIKTQLICNWLNAVNPVNPTIDMILELACPFVTGVPHADVQVDYPSMAGATAINLIDTVDTATDNTLASLTGGFTTNSDYLSQMSFGALATLGGALTLNAGPNSLAPITSISFPALTGCTSIGIQNFALLVTLNLPVLTSASPGGVNIQTCGSLLTVALNAFNTDGGGGVTINDCGCATIELPLLANPTGQLTFTVLNNLNSLILSGLITLGDGMQIGNTGLASLAIPTLTTVANGLYIHDNGNLTVINFSGLVTCTGGLNYTNMPLTGTVSLPALTTVPTGASGDSVTMSALNMTELDFPLLTLVGNVFDLDSCPNITTLHIPVLNSAQQINVGANPALTTVTFPATWAMNNVSFNGCALTQTMVDNILTALVAGAQNNGTVDVSGGTNATPGASGLTAKATLVGRGWTVNNN